MGELKQIYLLIQSDIVKDDVEEALNTFNNHYNDIKNIKGFQNFVVSVISTLAQTLQSKLSSTDHEKLFDKNTYHVIQFADRCFKLLILSELQPLQNSIYVIVRYLLLNDCITEAVHFSNYLLENLSSPCDMLKHVVQLFAHYIHKTCPINDDLKKSNVIMIWDAALNLVKHYTGKEIEYALHSLSSIIKSINGLVLHKGRSMDLIILDMTLESVLSSSVFRKKSDQDNIMNLYSMLIENITAVMQNMMRHKKMYVHFLIKHIELIIDVCCLNKIEKEALSFIISLFKFIDNSIKNSINSTIELRKMITFLQKYEPTSILPNTMLNHVFKAAIVTITKLKNLWYEGLVINSTETISQMFVLLQRLVYLTKHSSISQICCKSDNCNLNEDSTSEMSLINVVFIIIRHTMIKHETFLKSEDMLKWMKLFTSLFERVSKSNCSNKIPFIEFSLTSAYNLCIQTISSDLTPLYLDFLENICLMLDPSGIDPDLVARVTILLSRYLYNNNKSDEALRCIAYWCVRTRSELATQQWVYLKCKEERNNRIVNQTIFNMFENDIELKKKWPKYCLKKSDCIELMWLELKAHNCQHKIKEGTTTVLELFEELLSNELPRELKCRIIITTAYIILHSSNIHGLKTVIDVLEDCIRKLELEISMKNISMPLILGNLYYANFMCLLKHLQNLVCKELNLFTEERLERGMEQQNTTQYEPMSWIFPLQIKPKLFNCLNFAVKNWSALINDKIKDEYDVEILFRSLREVAFIFKLHCDPKEVEVWQLLYKLASNIKCHKYIFIALSELIKIGGTDEIELENLTKQLPKMVIDYKLTLATSLLNQSKYNDAQILLDNIDDRELNNVLLIAECSYLKSRLCFESGNFHKNKLLSIFIDAYNFAHSLIKRLDSFYDYLAMHFVILSICSYLNLIYINTFKPVEARYFLKVQMNIVLKSVLTKRALNVFIMNCWNELMCCNFENAKKHLEHVMTLLDLKEDELDIKMQKQVINNCANNIISSPSSDYRCMPNTRMNKMASPSLNRLKNLSTQMTIDEFCHSIINSDITHDPVIIHSVIETCILKAVYCSKANQQSIAENYFKLVFKLMKLTSVQFNKNEVYNILTAKQSSLAKYCYAEHLVLFNDLSKSLDYIQKAKETCHNEWLSSNINELYISLKINEIMIHPSSNVIHSPIAKSHTYEFKTPAHTKVQPNTKSRVMPRFVTPTVRKLKMTIESPKLNGNNIKSPLIKETEKIKNNSTLKRIIGKENTVKSTVKQEAETKVKEKRNLRKKENAEQLPLVIKKRSSRLNL